MPTLVRWAGPDVRFVDGKRTVAYTFRLPGRTWPSSAHLCQLSLGQDPANASAALSVNPHPPVFSGNLGTFAVTIDASGAKPGHYVVWFILKAGEAAAAQFSGRNEVFDEFFVRPDEETLQRAFRWTEDLPLHEVRLAPRPSLFASHFSFTGILRAFHHGLPTGSLS